MQSPTAFALALCFLLPFAAPQDRERPALQSRRATQQERLAAQAKDLVGAWQLISFSVNGNAFAQSQSAGYMIVTPSHLAIEIHANLPSGVAAGLQPFFQSGIRRWRLANARNLETSALIGNSNMNPGDRWRFDPPGTKRSFVLAQAGQTLTLEIVGKSKIIFRKLPSLPYPDRPTLLDDPAKAKREPADTDKDTQR